MHFIVCARGGVMMLPKEWRVTPSGMNKLQTPNNFLTYTYY